MPDQPKATGFEALLAAQGIPVEQAATDKATENQPNLQNQQLPVDPNPQTAAQPTGVVLPTPQQQPQAIVQGQPAGVNIVLPTPTGTNPQAGRGSVTPFASVTPNDQILQWQTWYMKNPQYAATIARFGVPEGFGGPSTPGNEILITISKSSKRFADAGWGWVAHYIEVGQNATTLIRGARKTGKWAGTYEFEHEVDPSSRLYLVKFLCSFPFQHGDETTNPIPIPGSDLVFKDQQGNPMQLSWTPRQPCWVDLEGLISHKVEPFAEDWLAQGLMVRNKGPARS